MKDIIFRLPEQEKKELKIKVLNLGFSVQEYLTALVNLDKKKNYIKAKQ